MINLPTTILPRPMGDVNSVMRDLDMNADRVRALVEQGTLIAFNITAVKSNRADLRILTKSVEHYRDNGGKKALRLEWPEIFRLIMPHNKFFVRGFEVARGLNCDRGHVENLIISGHLVTAKKAQPGPNGSPIITRGSFESFLIGRLQ
ncbi:MAG: hypothetical protein WCH99_04315 [Verrucomicrobiota bacterium]